MQNDKNYSELFERILTKDDAAQTIEEIEILISSLYKKDGGLEATLDTKVSRRTAEDLKSLLSNDRSNYEEELKKIRDQIENLEEIEITLAFYPSNQFIRLLVKWVRENLEVNSVINIQVDKTIIAGVIIVFKGRYVDLSLLKRLNKENVFENLTLSK